MKKHKKTGISFLGYCIFFVTIAFTVTVAVMIYSFVSEKNSKSIVSVIMLAVILLLAMACTVIDVVRRKIMVERPVNKILEGTDKIAAGDFTVRLETAHSLKRYDEYDNIMENLNKMAAELSKTEVLRTDFISNVSHELKTPLAVIQNYATAIQNEKLDSETRNQYAKILVATSKRLTDLIVNILKLNKLENQEIKSDSKRIRLDEMLAETILQYEELLESKNLQVDCDMDEITVYSSENFLGIVWSNLFSNAIKFTKAGGKISVRLKNENGNAVVKISDTGCGISKEVGEHIFEKFYQGDASHSQEGNGLGLALIKKVIDIIGGEISVQSEVGKGSVFTVVLSGDIR